MGKKKYKKKYKIKSKIGIKIIRSQCDVGRK